VIARRISGVVVVGVRYDGGTIVAQALGPGFNPVAMIGELELTKERIAAIVKEIELKPGERIRA
jgi:hypothetical protein